MNSLSNRLHIIVCIFHFNAMSRTAENHPHLLSIG